MGTFLQVMDYYGQMPLKHRLILSVLVAAPNLPQAQPSFEPPTQTLVSELSSGLFYQLLLGELNARADEPGAAFSLILDAARKTNDAALYKRAVHIALEARAGQCSPQPAPEPEMRTYAPNRITNRV